MKENKGLGFFAFSKKMCLDRGGGMEVLSITLLSEDGKKP